MKLARLFAACAPWLALAGTAHAQAVLLEVADCEGAPGAEVIQLAALELSPRMHVIVASEQPVLTGSVRCEPPYAHITVVDPARVEPFHLRLDLGAAAPQARKRLLALSLAELITTSQLEPASALSVPAAAPAAPASSSDEDPARSALSVWIAPSLSVAADPALALFGGELGAAYAFGPLVLSLDAQARFAESERPSSDVALRVLSLGAFAGLLLLDDGIQLSAGPGFRLGHAALVARTARAGLEGRELAGAWLGPALMAALQAPLAAPTQLRLTVEAGYIAKPVVGLDEHDSDRLALRGAWAAIALGLALALP